MTVPVRVRVAIVALILAVCCLFSAAPQEVWAYSTGDDYPYKNSSTSTVDRWRFYARQCTSFAAWCLESRNGVAFSNSYLGVRWSNANNWDDAARSVGITVDSNPVVGAIAQTDSGSYGHVAWVSAVSGDYVTVEEYNYKAYAWSQRTVRKSEFCYIHVKDIGSSVPTGSEIGSSGEREGITSGVEYYLVSAVDTGQLLDVSGYPNASGNDTQLYHHLYNTEQVFRVCYTDGFYHLQDYDSGCWLDVDSGSMERGASVQVWDGNGTKAQDWVIEDAGDGAFYIRSRLNGWYLDVLDGNSADGTKVRLWEGNGSNAQKWYFVPHYTGSPETIEEGDYYILSSIDESRALDVAGVPNAAESKMQLYRALYNSEQLFHVTRDAEGYYLLQDAESGCYLDVVGGSPANGARAQVYAGNGTAAQQWVIDKGDYGYTMRSRCSNFYLDVSGGSTDEGTEVRMWWGNGSAAQNWVFVSAVEETPDESVELQSMYRLYNPNSGEHFYTASSAEKANLVAAGWNDEGVGWTAPVTSNTPVYRVYNPNEFNNNHHYTTSKSEHDYLVSIGWKDEGIAWYGVK